MDLVINIVICLKNTFGVLLGASMTALRCSLSLGLDQRTVRFSVLGHCLAAPGTLG